MKPCPHCGTLCDPVKAHHPNIAIPGGSSHPNTFLAAGSVMLTLALIPLVTLQLMDDRATDLGVALFIVASVLIIGALCSAVGFMVAYGDWYVARCPKCSKGFPLSPKDLKGR